MLSWTVHLVGYNAVAENTGVFIRLAVVASETCEIQQNSPKIRTYKSSKVIDICANWKRIYATSY